MKKKNRLLCGLLAASMFFTFAGVSGAWASSAQTEAKGETKVKSVSGKTDAEIEQDAQAKGRKEAEKKYETVIAEAVEAVAQTQKVLVALNAKDKKAALDALAMVTGKLEVVMAREPEMVNAPVDVAVRQIDVYANADEVKKIIKKVSLLWAAGEIQSVRPIIANLASEIDIIETSLPLRSYADAMKKAAVLVEAEKYDEAKSLIYQTLSTLIVTEHVIPLPVLRAEALLLEADKLATKESRTDEENKALSELLDKVKKQIELAEILGYGDKGDYKAFYSQIKEIRKKTEGSKFGTGFLDDLTGSLKKFKEKIFAGEKAAANKPEVKPEGEGTAKE